MEQKKKIMIVGADGLLGKSLKELVRAETDWEMFLVTKEKVIFEGYKKRIGTSLIRESVENSTSCGFEIKCFNSHGVKNWKNLFNQIEKPDVVINCAAETNVDNCEINKKDAWISNVDLPENLVEICKKYDLKYIQLSSDYIFDGKKGDYTENSQPNPINYYGRTKLAAENICLKSNINYAIVRTMWLYNKNINQKGKLDFINWCINASEKNKTISIVDDEFGCPTYVEDVAFSIVKIIEKDYSGIININADEKLSRYEIAERIVDKFQFDCNILKIKAQDLMRKANRPLNSGMINNKSKLNLEMNYTPLNSGLDIIFNSKKILNSEENRHFKPYA